MKLPVPLLALAAIVLTVFAARFALKHTHRTRDPTARSPPRDLPI